MIIKPPEHNHFFIFTNTHTHTRHQDSQNPDQQTTSIATHTGRSVSQKINGSGCLCGALTPPPELTEEYHPPPQLVKNLAQIKRVINFPQNAAVERDHYLIRTVWLSLGLHIHELNPDNSRSKIQQDREDKLLKRPVCDSSRCLNFEKFGYLVSVHVCPSLALQCVESVHFFLFLYFTVS